MAFGQKAPEKPKAPTFYLKPVKGGKNGALYEGKIGEDAVIFNETATGRPLLLINGGKDNGGLDAWGKEKENKYGAYILFIIEGHFWYGKSMETKYGMSFQLKQGGVAEDSAEWKAKKAAALEGGSGPAGLAAPAGSPAGVSEVVGSAEVAAPRPPKPSNYKRS